MKKLALFAIFTLFLAGTSIAQDRYGHLNFGNLIAAMPETASANEQLETFQKELVAKGEQMAASFQKEYEQLVKDAQAGTKAPADLQKREADLQKKQQEILAYEQQIAKQVQERRNTLLKPIIEKAQNAIAAVAKANNFKLIFDSSVFNSVLFAQDSDDALPLVAKHLGIKIPTK